MTLGRLQPGLQQSQLWAQSRLLRALSNYILKTSKEGDGWHNLADRASAPSSPPHRPSTELLPLSWCLSCTGAPKTARTILNFSQMPLFLIKLNVAFFFFIFFSSLSGCCEASSSTGSPWGWAGQGRQPEPVPPPRAPDTSVGWGQTRPARDVCGPALGPVSAAPMAWPVHGCNPAEL